MVDTYAGSWWIADHRSEDEVRRVDGTLTIDDQGRAVLRTSGFLPLLLEPVNGVVRATSRPATALVVHGQVIGGRRMTLLRVSGNTPVVRAQAVLGGIWLSPGRPDDIAGSAPVPADRRSDLVPGEDVEAFAEIEVEIEHLGEWSASASLAGVVPRTPQQETVPLLTRSVHAEPTASLPDGVTVALRSRVGQRTQHRAGGSVIETTETIVARITTNRPASLETLLGHVTTVRRLVGLAVRREVGVLTARLRLADRATAPDSPHVSDTDDGADQSGLPLRKLFLPVGDRDAPVVERHRMLFTLAQMPFSEVLPRWARVAQDLRGTVAGLVAAHDTKALLETRLVSAVTAAENLFAQTHRGERLRRMPDADFTRLRDVVLAALNDHPDLHQYASFLRESIQNQPTLRQRLHLLVDDLGKHAAPLLCGGQVPTMPASDESGAAAPESGPRPSERREAQAWAWAAAKGRNEIAHEGLTASLDASAALATVDTTVALVELLVLRELGMTDDQLAELVRNRHHGLSRRIRDHLGPLFDRAQSAGAQARTPAPTTNPPADSEELVHEYIDQHEEDSGDNKDKIDPLVAALIDVVGANWQREWVPWQAVTAAARRRNALLEAADQHDDLQSALGAIFGAAAPVTGRGRNRDVGPGYSTLALFVSVNNHLSTAGRPFPGDRWRRHRGLRDMVAAVPVAASVLATAPADPDTLSARLTAALDLAGLSLTSRDEQHLSGLTTQHADDLKAWFSDDASRDATSDDH